MKDIRAWIVSLFIIVSLILTTMAVMASAEGKVKSSARAMALYSPDTDSFLCTVNADERLPMASTTKIMTALVVLENRELECEVTVPKEAVGIEGSSLYLSEGDTLTVRDLLYSLMLRSANDAAVTLAMEVGGDIAGFAELMNARAEKLGLHDTRFENPHGLDSAEHYTTARELSLIAAEALKNDIFREITGTYKYTFPLGEGVRTVVNHNKLLKMYDGTIGVKTGFTRKCGRCLVSAAERDGVRLIAVTLDDPNDWQDHKALFNFGFDALIATPLSSLTDLSFEIPTIGLTKEKITASAEDVSIVTKNGDALRAECDIIRYLTSEVKAGDTLGKIYLYKNGELYASYDVIASESANKVKRRGFFKF